jgi:hypothetical protein
MRVDEIKWEAGPNGLYDYAFLVHPTQHPVMVCRNIRRGTFDVWPEWQELDIATFQAVLHHVMRPGWDPDNPTR